MLPDSEAVSRKSGLEPFKERNPRRPMEMARRGRKAARIFVRIFMLLFSVLNQRLQVILDFILIPKWNESPPILCPSEWPDRENQSQNPALWGGKANINT
jgi:hypothetical protein